MARFLHLNLQNVTQNMAHICICCLDKGNEMINLNSCKHSGFLFNYVNVKLGPDKHLACQQCHAMLQKIYKFRLQVEASTHVLSAQIQNILEAGKKCIHLKVQPTHIIDSTLPLEPPKPLEHKLQDQKEPELKIESDHNFSDSESDLPLYKIKEESNGSKAETEDQKTVKKRKSNVKKEIKKTNPITKMRDNYEGLFKIIHLSEKEIKSERLKMAEDESFLKLPYKCNSCIVGFDYETNLDEHNGKKHNSKNGFKCETCLSVLGTEASYKDHVRRHATRYECLQCGKRVVTLESVRNHCGEQHGVDIRTRVFTCPHCAFTTTRSRAYRYHLDKHKEKPQCTECGRTFINSSILKNHTLTVHRRSERVFACAPCGKAYASRSGLSAHLHDHHHTNNDQRAFCEKCGSWFKSRRNLETHLRTSLKHRSTADDKFKCDECSKTFHIKSLLEEHISYVHLKETKYKCDRCGNKSFRNRSQLKKHIKLVHEKNARPRDKICDYCGRGFTCNTILRTHIRTHTGERPLRCEHCAATFAHPGALFTHTRLLHADRRAAD